MLLSMTGYGRATCQDGDHVISVELKSVNHRYLDIGLSLPREWMHLEEGLKRECSSKLKRGKVTGFISVEGAPFTTTKIDVNWDVFDQYRAAFSQMKERLEDESMSTFEVRDVLQVPHLFNTIQIPAASISIEDRIRETFLKALDDLFEMRLTEGQNLKKDVLGRLDLIKAGAERIETRSPQVVQAYQERLQKRIRELLSSQGEMDESRIINEVAIFAEKTDLAEEVTRLLSHLDQFHLFLNQGGPVGRQLDFLIQEINREINTMGSKSPDVELTQEVVRLKGELEKIREQVQNIE